MSRYSSLPVIKRVVKSKTKTLSLRAVQFEYLIIQKRSCILYIILYNMRTAFTQLFRYYNITVIYTRHIINIIKRFYCQ